MFNRKSLAALFAVFALSACEGVSPIGGNEPNEPTPVIVTVDGQELFVGDRVAANTVLPPSDCLDYRAQFRLLQIEAQDGNGLLDRVVWNQAVDSAFENFQQPLATLFNAPFQALSAAQALSFEVQADGTLVATATIDIDGVPTELKVILDPNDDFSAGTAQFLLNNVLRFEITGDFAATNINISVFDEAGAEQFDVAFVRNGANFNVVFTNLVNANKFTVDLNGTNLLIERDKAGDGVLDDNGEFRVTVDIATFNGEFTAVVPVLGDVTLGF